MSRVKNVLWVHDVSAANCNAQSLNAKAILSRWPEGYGIVSVLTFRAPDSRVVDNERVRVIRVYSTRLLLLQLTLVLLSRRWHVIVLPGLNVKVDLILARLARAIRPSTRIVVTMEGLLTTQGELSPEIPVLSDRCGHPVFGQQVEDDVYRARAELVRRSDLVVAISEFLAKCATVLYPADQVAMVPLGVDLETFYPSAHIRGGVRRVMSAGSLVEGKRPDLFVRLAGAYPQLDFEWYGDGPLMAPLVASIEHLGLKNIKFCGPVSPQELAGIMRECDLFLFPSIAEGLPKVTQEAAACGLPVLAMHYYEPHSVADGINGFLAKSDCDLFARLELLVNDPLMAEEMRTASIALASTWDWDRLSAEWASICVG